MLSSTKTRTWDERLLLVRCSMIKLIGSGLVILKRSTISPHAGSMLMLVLRSLIAMDRFPKSCFMSWSRADANQFGWLDPNQQIEPGLSSPSWEMGAHWLAQG
jgi:hypothetical protein